MINGFDPIFRAAGDDVDLCWRLQNKGYKIGFSPAAVVWHFRRNTIRDYLKQQRGYGKAETLLFFKHPSRFNVLGQSRWFGRIYGDLSSFLASRQPRIYSGVFGRGLFQTLYQPPPSVLSCLPLTLEWNLLSVLLLVARLSSAGFLAGDCALLPHSSACLASALRGSRRAAVSWLGRDFLVALLIYVGTAHPYVRALSLALRRFREVKPFELTGPARSASCGTSAPFISPTGTKDGQEKESLLYPVMDFLLPRKYLIAMDQGWSHWDLEICQGPWAKAQIRAATENHGSAKRLLRVRCALRMSRISLTCLCLYLVLMECAAFLSMPTSP